MSITRTARASTLSCTLLILAAGWLAAPHASQKGASEGFILFGANQDLTNKSAVQDALVNFYFPPNDKSTPLRPSSSQQAGC